jgi:Putative metallopeptidase
MNGSNGHLVVVVVILVLVQIVGGCRSATSGVQSNANQPEQNSSAQAQPSQDAATPSDKGDLKLRYNPRKNANAAGHRVGTDPKALEKLIADLNNRLILPSDLYVSFEDCELPDALYDPDTSQITICYQLIDEFYDLFSRDSKNRTRIDEAVRNATAATFFHELGHALIDVWQLPVTGREEDAVDQLSTLVLIEGAEEGAQMALDGAMSFKLTADLFKAETKQYWDEHSLEEQRFYDTICLIYGHDDQKYDYLVTNGTLPEERAIYCVEDYLKVKKAWGQLLRPYLKPQQPHPKMKFK